MRQRRGGRERPLKALFERGHRLLVETALLHGADAIDDRLGVRRRVGGAQVDPAGRGPAFQDGLPEPADHHLAVAVALEVACRRGPATGTGAPWGVPTPIAWTTMPASLQFARGLLEGASLVLAVGQQHDRALLLAAGGEELDGLGRAGANSVPGQRQRARLHGVEEQIEHGDVDGQRRQDQTVALRLRPAPRGCPGSDCAMRRTSDLATQSRDGATSAVAIESEVSSTKTMSTPWRSTLLGASPQRGRASRGRRAASVARRQEHGPPVVRRRDVRPASSWRHRPRAAHSACGGQPAAHSQKAIAPPAGASASSQSSRGRARIGQGSAAPRWRQQRQRQWQEDRRAPLQANGAKASR